MKTSTILNVALAIALVFLGYKLAVTGGEKAQQQDTSEVVLNNILERTSIRSYQDQSVEEEKIVWTGAYPAKERYTAVSEVLGLPETLVPLNTIVIGYPDGDVTPKDKWKESNISYNMYGEE